MSGSAVPLPRVWLDYSFARPDLRQAKREGATGVLRYLSVVTDKTRGKIITPAERDRIFAAGLDLALNWEWYEGRCNEGAQAGHHDAAEAMKQAKALGYPRGACIYFSHDTGVNNWAHIDAYFGEVGKVLAGYYDVGVYSGYHVVKRILDRKLAKYGWQTLAWSNGFRDPRIVLYQDGSYWFGKSADEDLAAAYIDAWKQQVKGPPGPAGFAGAKVSPEPTPPQPIRPCRVWTVCKGETLSQIAGRFGVSVDQLVCLNHISNRDLILPGQVLHIDQQAPAPAIHPTGIRYTVERGDNLTSIARKYPQAWITATSIMCANHLTSDHIEPGQVLSIA
ncbi:LysM peptidoglycan-binding domain-containing protein [Jatrophihabitans sp.]|uniref:LysM peptidoglycan-binding domain-containing protein n=1 Tax=Jatrophihabitans sp. TaxID=1932789 RepID=UPI002EFCA64E